ncbi:unnamed protein product [Eretmochelys imbricata]
MTSVGLALRLNGNSMREASTQRTQAEGAGEREGGAQQAEQRDKEGAPGLEPGTAANTLSQSSFILPIPATCLPDSQRSSSRTQTPSRQDRATLLEQGKARGGGHPG